jgi:hypothetical protein
MCELDRTASATCLREPRARTADSRFGTGRLAELSRVQRFRHLTAVVIDPPLRCRPIMNRPDGEGQRRRRKYRDRQEQPEDRMHDPSGTKRGVSEPGDIGDHSDEGSAERL